MAEKIKLALFKPNNARRNNAFYSGEHFFLKYLQQELNYNVTYFLDDIDINFDGVLIKYIKRKKLTTLVLKALKKMGIYYVKLPYYGKIDFSKYDVIVTEGIHYRFIDYFKHIPYKTILNDTISRDYNLSYKQISYLNKYFSNSLAIVVNKKIPQLYKKNGLNIKTSVIGHSLNSGRINFSERRECNGKLVSIGRLVPEKGFKYIIDAINVLKDKYPTLKLDIYGEGLLENDLSYYIKKKNLENYVFLKGHIAYEGLMNKLREYDLFISHPLETTWIAEAFLMANMEAMAAGLPVITSDCGGVPYIVRDKAVVVKQKDVEGIAITIEEFMRDPQKVKRYSAEGRKYIEGNFRIEFIAKRWDKAIRDFLKISSIQI